MTNKVKYPIEAFALAMVLFTTGITGAAVMAAALVVVGCALSMLQGKLGNKIAAIIGLVAGCAAGAAASLVSGGSLNVDLFLSAVAVGVLMGKHYYCDEAEDNMVAIIAAGLGVLVVGVIRSELSGSSLAIMSSAYGKAMFGLIFGAMAIAIVNKIAKTNGNSQAGLWVCFASIVCEAPFVLDRFGEIAGSIVGMAVVGVMYYTFRNKLVFTNAEDTTKGLPIEMALLGMIYMIVTIL